MSKFEIVKDSARKFLGDIIIIPQRATKDSAGYDFYSNEDYELAPGEIYIFWTDVKVRLDPTMFLDLRIRSSLGFKGLMLANNAGVIDSDYYSNVLNDGNIGVMVKNTNRGPFTIKKADRIAQGIITQYFITEDDESRELRAGGIGSTNTFD